VRAGATTNIGRQLPEHCASVLGAAVEATEHVQAQQRSAVLDANNLPSLLSSPAHKFDDGVHLFAGHEDTSCPGRNRVVWHHKAAAQVWVSEGE
jgi:hypothetical protein